MTTHKRGGWYGEPGRHADAARGISTKGVTREERKLRRQTLEFLAEKESVEKGVQEDKYYEVGSHADDNRFVNWLALSLVEDFEGWTADRIEDRLNELNFWNVMDWDALGSEEELFWLIANSDAPDDVYPRLQGIVWRDNPNLTSTQLDQVANDTVTAGARLVAKAAWQDMYEVQ